MKTALIFLAVIALAYGAAIKDDKKELEGQSTERPTDKPTEKPIEEKTTEKPIEKPAGGDKNDKPAEDGHLQWPLPDSHSEGDLILYGKHLFDRVEELHKAKPENDVDRMILDVGRDFLRKCNKYLESARDFKIVPALCRDSRELFKNVSRRWEIRLEAEQAPVAEKKEESVNKDNKQEPVAAEQQQPKPQSDAAQQTKTKRDASKEKKEEEKKDKDIVSTTTAKPDDHNSTDVNATEPSVQKPEADAPARPTADQAAAVDRENYEARRTDFYRRVGDNFARLLLKSWRKEKLSEEERAFVENWSAEEAIHYGTMGIYCQEGENAKDLIKKIKDIVEEK